MTKLMSANLMRLKKDKILYVCMAFMFIFGSFIMINSAIESRQYSEYEIGTEVIDTIFFPYIAMIGILMAVFGGLFLGTEYGDGTMRNKLIVGHSRAKIYLANFLTCFIAGLLMCLAYIVPALIFGLTLIGGFTMNPIAILILVLLTVLTVAALTAVVVLMCTLNQNRALSAVLVIIVIIILSFIALYIQVRLSAPEFYDGYVFMSSEGDFVEERSPNPEYLQPNERAVYQFLLDLLPTGQSVQLSSATAAYPVRMAICAVAVTVLCCAAGIITFKKLNIN